MQKLFLSIPNGHSRSKIMGKILVLGSVVRGTISFLLGRRWTRWLTIGMVLIAAGPRLLSWTPLPAWIVSRALADINGTIEVGGVTMGWFARVGLRDVVIRDRNG